MIHRSRSAAYRSIERNPLLIYDGHFLEEGANDGYAEPLDQEIHLEQNETQTDDRCLLILLYPLGCMYTSGYRKHLLVRKARKCV